MEQEALSEKFKWNKRLHKEKLRKWSDQQHLRSSCIFGFGDYISEWRIKKNSIRKRPFGPTSLGWDSNWMQILDRYSNCYWNNVHYTYHTLAKTTTEELYIFSYASEKAISAVVYLSLSAYDSRSDPNIWFILVNSKEMLHLQVFTLFHDLNYLLPYDQLRSHKPSWIIQIYT